MNKIPLPPRYTICYSTIVLWFLFAVLTFFVGFRWDVGIDWPAYMDMFSGNIADTAMYLDRIEPANLAIKVLLLVTGFEDGGYYLWVMGFITMFLCFYSIRKYSVSPLFSIILFVLLGMYFDLMNGVRQYTAISIVTFSWRYLFDKSLVRYILTVLVASLFHTSAIVMLPIYFVCNFKFNKQVLIILAAISIPLSFFITPIVGVIMSITPQYEVYSDSNFANTSNVFSIMRSLFPLCLFIMIMMIYKKLLVERTTRIITNLSLISIFCTLLFPGIMLMIRIGFYFQIAFIFLIPIMCQILSPNNSKFLKWFSLIYAIIFTSITQLSRPISNIIPFELDFRLADSSLIIILLITFLASILFTSLMNLNIKNKKYH